MKSSILGAVIFAVSVSSVSAATVSIDSAELSATGASGGFTLVGGGVQNSSNCPAERPCIRLNQNEAATLTFNDGDAFTLSSLLFSLQGTPAQLTVTPNSGTPFVSSTFQGNNVGLATGDLGGDFVDILSVVFTNSGTGTVRIGGFFGEGEGPMPSDPTDDPVSEVPLPAGGLLLISGLVGLAAAKRRKTAAA